MSVVLCDSYILEETTVDIQMNDAEVATMTTQSVVTPTGVWLSEGFEIYLWWKP